MDAVREITLRMHSHVVPVFNFCLQFVVAQMLLRNIINQAVALAYRMWVCQWFLGILNPQRCHYAVLAGKNARIA